MEKRGQVTIYIVVGIVVVALAVLVFNFRENIFTSEWERQQQASLTVPEMVKDVQRLVLGCIEKTGEDGANILGLQGGYIRMPEDQIPPMPNNPFSTALRIIPNQEYVAPYWFYKSANGILKTSVPSKGSMESALAAYMDENLAACTLNFTMFEEFNITSGEIRSKAQIQDTQILFTVDYPVIIQVGEFTFKFPSFYQDVQVSLGKLFSLAKEMLEKVKSDSYLEDFTIDILAVNPKIPFSGTEDSCVPKFWNIENVKTEFRTDLETNIPHIKVKGTNFVKGSDYFVWGALKSSGDDVHVQLRYSPRWPLQMDVFPSDNGVMTAEPLSDPNIEEMAYVSSFLCLLDYNFIYDITYPVLIVLTDENGYVFQFAIHVVIDNNQPKQNVLAEDDFSDENPLICQAAVTPMTVNVMGSDTFTNIEDADVKLKCVGTVCDLGKTRMNDYGQAILLAKSPACVNALMTADKQGYHKGRQLVDTTEQGSITIMMDKLREKPYEIKLVEDSGYVRVPAEGETVIITLNEENKKYSSMLSTGTDVNTVKLIPGTYAFSASVSASSDQGFYIQGRSFDKCVETPQSGLLGIFFSVKDENCYTAEVPGMTLDHVITGGAKFDWPVASTDLDRSSKITFYVPVKMAPKTQEEMLAIQESMASSSTVIYPEYAQ